MPKDKTRQTAIIIVNFNSGPALARCLDAIEQIDSPATTRVIVVDNASRDGSERGVEDRGPRFQLLRSATNRGFAAGVNMGARAATTDIFLLLNPDCILQPSTLPPLLAELDSHPRCAVAAPVVRNEDGSAQGNLRGDPSMATGLFGRRGWLRRLLPDSDTAQRNVVHPLATKSISGEVDWVSGACMLVRRQAFEETGGFDEGYFLYWEDADFCRRLRNRGWTIRYRTDADVVHCGGQSSRTVPVKSTVEFHRSAFRYYATHVAPRPWQPARAMAALLLTLRCGWAILAAALTRQMR